MSLYLIASILTIGTINTIISKLQDKICIDQCKTNNPIYFEQPLFQTLNMFIGESMCLVVYLIYEYRKKIENSYEQEEESLIPHQTPNGSNIVFKNWKLILPTLCDVISSTCMNVGLILVSPSIFQTLRGSLIIFTALISIIFLRKKYTIHQMISLFIIFSGISIVGTTVSKIDNTSNTIGICMILLAQVFTATQYVLEEKILATPQQSFVVPEVGELNTQTENSVTPLLAVGLEGIFGIILVLLISPVYFVLMKVDPVKLFYQITSNYLIWISSILLVFTIAIINYLGLTLTKKMSSVSRTTIDACRILVVWIVSIIIGWEVFNLVQLLGFLIMLSGIYIYFTSEKLTQVV
jgi:drug/metabolite transporter (DMT)-like permease